MAVRCSRVFSVRSRSRASSLRRNSWFSRPSLALVSLREASRLRLCFPGVFFGAGVHKKSRLGETQSGLDCCGSKDVTGSINPVNPKWNYSRDVILSVVRGQPAQKTFSAPFQRGEYKVSSVEETNHAGIRAVTGRLPRGKGRFRGIFNPAQHHFDATLQTDIGALIVPYLSCYRAFVTVISIPRPLKKTWRRRRRRPCRSSQQGQ